MSPMKKFSGILFAVLTKVPHSADMRLFVKALTGKTITLYVKPSELIEDVKGCLNFREAKGACKMIIEYIEKLV